MAKKRRVISIKRPVVPHLHLVNLRPEEALIDQILFKSSKTPPATLTTKTLYLDDKGKNTTLEDAHKDCKEPTESKPKGLNAEQRNAKRKRKDVKLLKAALVVEKTKT